MKRRVGVFGLGYIGLPLALSYCVKGYKVIGVETNGQKVKQLESGITDVAQWYQGQPLQRLLQKHLAARNFIPTTRAAWAAWEADAYIVTEGISVHQGITDDRLLLSVAEQIGKVIKPNDLVVILTTVIQEKLENKVIPLLEQFSYLRAGEDFHVACAAGRATAGRATAGPSIDGLAGEGQAVDGRLIAERVPERCTMEEFQTQDFVLAGLTEQCYQKAAKLLADLTLGQIHRTDFLTTQAAKAVENIQRISQA